MLGWNSPAIYHVALHPLPAGTAFGGLLGGVIGDWAAKHWPRHGRIAVTQFSVGVGIPFALLLLKVRGQ